MAVGIPAESARRVAELMAESDARGGDAHGVFRLPQYVKQIEGGTVNPRPNIQVVSNHAGSALVDGDNALGHLVMLRATELAIEKARMCGVAWVGTRRSNHAGPAQLYPRMAAAQDMIGMYFCVGNANLLPPWGGTESLLSTNPISISVPGLRHPTITLDMATTNTAFGKIRLKAQRGEPMPEGWMIDREGKPLTDAKRASEGFLLPIGGPKGYGLALMIGLLAGTLNGAASVPNGAASSTLSSTSHGVSGLNGLSLSTAAQNSTEGSVISSASKNVHLDSGTEMILQVAK